MTYVTLLGAGKAEEEKPWFMTMWEHWETRELASGGSLVVPSLPAVVHGLNG